MRAVSTITVLAIAAKLALAQSDDDSCGCPTDYNYLSIGNNCWCCPGTVNANNNGNSTDIFNIDASSITGYCCVHGSDDSSNEKRSLSPKIPAAGMQKRQQAITVDGQTCSTTIQLTASDYSSLVLAASTLTGGSAAATTSAGTATTEGSTEPTSSAAQSSQRTGSASSTPSGSASGNAGVKATSVPIILAGGLGLAMFL